LSQLTIYKASAGSGKTHRITGEYLKLLFDNPDNYRHILGVTFTNKATAEMKSRIITELYKLSKGEKSDYTKVLTEYSNIKASELNDRAALILYRILHDYSHFTISTIDSFFQKVIRTFGREIGLLQGFEIELDQSKVLQASIDQMIFRIDSHPELKEWLIRFAEDKIVEGQSWNITADIESLGNELFKENYKEFADKLQEKITNKNFLKDYSKKLGDCSDRIEAKVKALALEAKSILQNSGVCIDEFKGKSRGIGAWFFKLDTKNSLGDWKISDTIRRCYDTPEEWFPAKSNKQPLIESLFHEGLNRILGELLTIYDNDFIIYRSITKVQKNLYVLGMIVDLQAQIREYTSDKNLFLISDTAQFLYKLMDGSDAPFVYERTGTFIHHFMIDEFQDTSVLQWKNFKPLVINSLAENNQNWVVGDVKQSIYRWRNSDWTILSEKIAGEIYPHRSSVETLNYNWRSCTNIVRFNNTFFRNALDQLSLMEHKPIGDADDNTFARVLLNAYSGFEQLVPESKLSDEGIVRMEIIPAESRRNKEWQNEVLEKLPALITQLQDSGYSLSDVAILVRDRKEAKLVSDYFLNFQKNLESTAYRYDILSGDSLLLKNSEIVKWIIACFTYIVSPTDKVNATFLAFQYQQFVKSFSNADISSLFDLDGELLLPEELKEYFINRHLKQLSIYELTDELILYFGLNQLVLELPFLQAFQDLLHNYVKREPADIHSFLNWWDEHQDKQVISMPDNQDAMRLMTFHSSKGLEFPVVVVPFGDWEILKTTKSNNYLWCNPKVSPLDDMDLLPVVMSKGLEETIFVDEYLKEKALLYVDNLNLLYVAFTRAIDGLYLFVPEHSEDGIKNNVASLISNSIKNQYFEIENSKFPAAYLPAYFKAESNVFEFGTLPVMEKKKSKTSDLLMNSLAYPVRNISDVTHQVITATEYFQDDENRLASHLNSGKVMHELFQYIRTRADLDKALLKVLSEGKLIKADLERVKIFINAALDDPQVNSWFQPDWELKNEVPILLPDGTLQRPDRVMIKDKKAIVVDYKFGNDEKPAHQHQVANYMRYLRQMGYTEIRGFVWYVGNKKVVPVITGVVEQGRLF
jgi:ATP-dependent exoDNAse (exonuclease V) beta subunit